MPRWAGRQRAPTANYARHHAQLRRRQQLRPRSTRRDRKEALLFASALGLTGEYLRRPLLPAIATRYAAMLCRSYDFGPSPRASSTCLWRRPPRQSIIGVTAGMMMARRRAYHWLMKFRCRCRHFTATSEAAFSPHYCVSAGYYVATDFYFHSFIFLICATDLRD